MSALEEMRRAYRAIGWNIWYRPAWPNGMFYAATASGRYPGQGETLFSVSPLVLLRRIQDHPRSKRIVDTEAA